MELRLFVSNGLPDAYRAALRELIAHLGAGTDLEIIDIHRYPEAAEAAKIVDTPTLMKVSDPPRRVIGMFTEAREVADYLELPPW